MKNPKIVKAKALHKTAVKRLAAGYASYESARKIYKIAAERLFHVISFEEDYGYAKYNAAMELAAGAQVNLGQRQRTKDHQESDEFTGTDWTLLKLPGTIRLVQARKLNGDTLAFRAPLQRDLDVVRRMIAEIVESNESEVPVFDPEEIQQHTRIRSWDAKSHEWNYGNVRVARSFGSVFIPEQLQQDIVMDLKRFVDSRERLNRVEMPWRRGYLLTGPPGTGKTSLSLAIAGALGFSLNSLSLTDIASDGELRKAVNECGRSCVLVIEDIDAYEVSHSRDHNSTTDGKLSLSGLLNALDGFETPEGLVVIATTNHVEKLDPALTRNGRFDRTFNLGHIAAHELDRLFTWFYMEDPAEPFPLTALTAKLAPAEIAELFKQNLDDPEAGRQAVLAAIESRTSTPTLSAVSAA